jgi:PhnB protein
LASILKEKIMVQAIPEGVAHVVPYLCIKGAKKAIAFYQKAFGAEVMSEMPMGDDLVGHADLKIGNARVYLADEVPFWPTVKSPKSLKATTFNLHLWVEDCDVAFAKAVAAGCKVVMPLTDQFWGDRYGQVVDPFGHLWAITSHKEDVPPEEMGERAEEAMKKMPQPAAPKSKDKAKKVGKAEKLKAKAAKKEAKAEKKANKHKKDKKRKKKSKR